MKRVFIDANVLVRIIVDKDYTLLRYLVGVEPYTLTNVLEEAAYRIIALSILEVKGEPLSS